jgi:hypothetical protein
MSVTEQCFGLALLFDLENHNCIQIKHETYYYLTFTEVQILVAVPHTPSVCRLLLKNSVPQNYIALLQPSQIQKNLNSKYFDTWRGKDSYTLENRWHKWYLLHMSTAQNADTKMRIIYF